MDNIFLDLTTALINLIRPLFSAFSPLITGLIIAYLLNPVVSWFEKRLHSRGFSILITYILSALSVTAILCGFVILIIGALPQGGINTTLHLIRKYFADAMAAVADFVSGYIPQLSPDLPQDALLKLQEWLSDRFSLGSVMQTVTAVTGGLISFFIGIVASIYLLKDKDFFIRLWEKFLVLVLPQRIHGVVREVTEQINSITTTFIKGALVDSIIVAFLSSAALTVIGMDFAVVIGILAGILNIIPYFGPFISMVPAFLAALISGGPVRAISAAAALFIVQQLDSNYIYPKIVGSTTGLHPLFVLLSVSVSGYFWGIAGMLLAVPAAGILQVLISRWAYSKN
ncbi:MAG: AI-2E family transporter [Firmicutes bacterium]|nr:AI-2E family transporter [Bacillota bacterium]MBQ9960302.1 AI-2E family transporter [Bacillota bacterium]